MRRQRLIYPFEVTFNAKNRRYLPWMVHHRTFCPIFCMSGKTSILHSGKIKYFDMWQVNFQPLNIIDAIAVFPSLVSMMADMDELVFLKTLRALRILKMARYSRGLRIVSNFWPVLCLPFNDRWGRKRTRILKTTKNY